MVRLTTRILAVSALVGLAAGLASVLLDAAGQTVNHFALDLIAGYHPGATAAGEATLYTEFAGYLNPWLLLAILPIGGLSVGLISWWWGPKDAGHGTDAAILAYHKRRGFMPARIPLLTLITSTLTIGTGGSGGREGPIAAIGAGLGSIFGVRLGFSDHGRRLLLASGVGAGIGAIFHAPLAGALFATEVLYREVEFESEVLIPAFMSTIIAYSTYNVLISLMGQTWLHLGHFDGFAQLFTVAPGIRFRDPTILAPLTVLMLVTVGASWLYVKCFYGVHHYFDHLKIRPWVKPAIGALATGLVAIAGYFAVHHFYPESDVSTLAMLAVGYGFVQQTLSSPDGSHLILAVLIVVGLGKILTTSLTISSGGSAGVFAPMVVIGGALGAAVGLVFHGIAPHLVTRVDVFAILGIAGLFSSCSKTPLSAIMMVTEMTGSYELLLPAMWVCALAYLLSRRWTMFVEQVPRRADSPAHREDFIIDVLQGMTIRQAIEAQPRQFVTVPLDMPLREVAKVITQTRQACFPVVNAENRYQGLFSVDDVRQFLYDPDAGELAVALDLSTPATTPDAQPLASDSDLAGAIQRFATSRFSELPVVDPQQPDIVVAMIRRLDVIAAYNTRLLQFRAGTPLTPPRSLDISEHHGGAAREILTDPGVASHS